MIPPFWINKINLIKFNEYWKEKAKYTALVEVAFFSEASTGEHDWVAPLLPVLEENTERSGAVDVLSPIPLLVIREKLIYLG